VHHRKSVVSLLFLTPTHTDHQTKNEQFQPRSPIFTRREIGSIASFSFSVRQISVH
jgi:hypothetical protein